MDNVAHRLPIPISGMAPWSLWSRIDLLELRPEDAAAVLAGNHDGADAQARRARRAIARAKRKLAAMPISSTVPS